jgi:hypothetical protein
MISGMIMPADFAGGGRTTVSSSTYRTLDELATKGNQYMRLHEKEPRSISLHQVLVQTYSKYGVAWTTVRVTIVVAHRAQFIGLLAGS